jgi:GH15 family glucan-1,4-alpha-glucosidase
LYCGLNVKGTKIAYNETVDCSSVFGAYIFGLFDVNSPEILNSVETVKQLFGVNDGALGLPRYENDYYRRVSPGITGNHWFITSFWLAQYYIDTGESEKALQILDWAKGHATNTGVMGEQLDPVTNEIVSPAPLTWTHAEYIATLLDLIAKDSK